MARQLLSRTLADMSEDLERREPRSPRPLYAREVGGSGTSPSPASPVGLVSGILFVVALSGIAIFLIIRKRLPSKTPVRHGYSRTSMSEDPYLNAHRGSIDWSKRGCRYDPESAYGLPPRAERNPIYREVLRLDTSDSWLAAPKQSTLMQSAISPPPFSPYPPVHQHSLPGYSTQSQAEIQVADTPVDKVNPYGLPKLPIWSSIWPSGWTGQGKGPNAPENDSEDDSDESFISEKEKDEVEVKSLTDKDDFLRYAPSVLSYTAPVPQRVYRPPHSDDGQDDTEALELELTRLIEDSKSAENSTTNYFSLPFGLSRSSTKRSYKVAQPGSGSQSQAPSRAPSFLRSARSTFGLSGSTSDQVSGAEMSAADGRTFSNLIGRLAAPFSNSNVSRETYYEQVMSEGQTSRVEPGALVMSPEPMPLARLPNQPDSSPQPPMSLGSSASFRDALPLTTSDHQVRSYPDLHTSPETTSLILIPLSAQPVPRSNDGGHARSVSGSTTTTIRPLPVLPRASQ